MQTIHSPSELQTQALSWKREGKKIGLVPTMGALHEGHLSLIDQLSPLVDRVVVSIFVNPLQFGANEDFTKYPRTLLSDTELLLANQKTHVIFAPAAEDFYPVPFRTRMHVGELSEYLCGASRPGHFDGVATVCLRLFLLSQCDAAIFGEKDFQQLRILEQLVKDTGVPMDLYRGMIVRERDGLAKSSRNRYLTPAHREEASIIFKALTQARTVKPATVQEYKRTVQQIFSERQVTFETDYLEIVEEQNLIPLPEMTLLTSVSSPRALIAVRYPEARLIDNLAL